MKKKKAFIVIGIWIVCIGTFFWLNATIWKWDAATLKEEIARTGAIAPLIYVLAYTVRPLVLFPASLLSIAGGLVFGPLWGTVWTVVGASSGALVAFVSARWLFRFWNRASPRHSGWETIQKEIANKGFVWILIVRLVPLVPFDVVSYGAGLSRVSIHAFFWATVLGILPGTFAYNQFGYALGMGDWTTIVLSALLLSVCIIVPLWMKRRVQRASKKKEPSPLIDAIVFYDGDCAFCQNSIVRLLRWDARRNMYVASLQSHCARDVLATHAAAVHDVDSLVLWHRGHVYVRAHALRRIGLLLGSVWGVLAVLSYALPWLDRVYDVIAKRRHLLSRNNACIVPHRSWQSRSITDQRWAVMRKDVWNEQI